MKRTYICKCGRTIEKSSTAESTGNILTDYSPEHECYGCPYIVEYEDWQTKEIIKRECRATPKLEYHTYHSIDTEDKDFSAAYFYTLDLSLARRVYYWCQLLDGCTKIIDGANGGFSHEYCNSFPKRWRAADFANANGMIKFPIAFDKNKKGTAARREIVERFFSRQRSQDEERELVVGKIQIEIENAKREAGINITSAPVGQKSESEGKAMTAQFNIGNLISQDGQVKEIPLDMLNHTYNHQFTLYDEERRQDMESSIRQNGVLIPVIVRPDPREPGKYEILAGNNRKRGCEDAGKATCPCIIKEQLSEEEAQMYIIESNLLQRGFNDLKISERAAVLAVRYEQMFSQGKRSDIIAELTALQRNSDEDKKVRNSREKLGDEYGLSRNSVARLLRINKLYEPIKAWVDAGLSIRAGVELSYLPVKTAEMLVSYMEEQTPDSDTELAAIRMITQSAAESIRSASDSCTIKDRYDIAKLFEKPEKPKIKVVKLKEEIVSKYFDEDYNETQIQEIIKEALEMFFNSDYKD